MTICDYEGHDYRGRFWEQGREYEDLAERYALRRLLPQRGQRLVEIGAGFGRLADLYTGFQQVILLDPAYSLLQEARDAWGGDDRFLFVRAVADRLPLVDGACDAAVMVRVMHHLTDVEHSLAEIRRSCAPGGTFVCEYANKRNLKAILRHWLNRQAWSPFDPEPIEFAPLHYDFHPDWMAEQFADAGFVAEREVAVSLFRLPQLKRFVPARLLAALDGALQPLISRWKLGPSVFVEAHVSGEAPSHVPTDPFRCPTCHMSPLHRSEHSLVCSRCRSQWPWREGIYDFIHEGARTGER